MTSGGRLVHVVDPEDAAGWSAVERALVAARAEGVGSIVHLLTRSPAEGADTRRTTADAVWNRPLAEPMRSGAVVVAVPCGSNLWQVVDGYDGYLRSPCERLEHLLDGLRAASESTSTHGHARAGAASLSTPTAFRAHLDAYLQGPGPLVGTGV